MGARVRDVLPKSIGRNAVCVVIALVLLAAAASAFGGEQWALAGPSPVHVHGLGVTRDGALLVATHAGLYRLDKGRRTLEPVGDRRPDTMGLAVLGDGRLLASGHPDPRDTLPGLLGLQESRDGGKHWQPLSLLGRADFHVLRARLRTVVGYDASTGRVMVSRDGGATWRSHRFNGPLVDLALAPLPSDALLASTQAQVIRSNDGGTTWRAVAETTGFLAWPSSTHLYLLAPDGHLWWSPNNGRRWQSRGKIGGNPVAFAVAGSQMYAALDTGEVKASLNGGRSWRRAGLLPG